MLSINPRESFALSFEIIPVVLLSRSRRADATKATQMARYREKYQNNIFTYGVRKRNREGEGGKEEGGGDPHKVSVAGMLYYKRVIPWYNVRNTCS